MKSFCLSFLLVILFLTTTNTEEVTILDTRNATSDLGWPSTPGGWTEVTSTDETDADLRTFEVCKIQRPNQNNWFRTPYLDISGAHRVGIEFRFAVRSCQGIKKIHSCKNTFNIFYLPSNAANDPKASQMNDKSYIKLATVAAGKRFDAGTITSFTQTKVIPFLSSAGLYVAFQDTGACVSIIYIRVFHKVCPETVIGLARFPATNTGQEFSSLVEVKGKCVQNSQELNPKSAPILHCNSEGNWLLPSMNCFCSKGFEPNHELTECIECPAGKYKPKINNKKCKNCPSNSYSPEKGATVCKCKFGHFRPPKNNSEDPCYRLPSPPVLPKYITRDSSILIMWSKPRDFGGAANVTYSISCNSCNSSYDYCSFCNQNIRFLPKKFQLQQTEVSVLGLLPGSHYRFKISSFNLVSSISNLTPSYAELKVKVNFKVTPTVSNLRVVSTSSNNAVLRWTSSNSHSNENIRYQVQYSVGQKTSLIESSQTVVVLQRLQPAASYSVQVRTRNGDRYGAFSRTINFETKQAVSNNNYESPGHINANDKGKNETSIFVATQSNSVINQDHLVLAISVSCSFAVILLFVLLLLCGKHRRITRSSTKDKSKYPEFKNSAGLLTPYADSSIYEDPHVAVLQFAKEVHPKAITLEKTICSGEFGDISKAVLNLGTRKHVVVVKTLKNNRNNEQKVKFLSEASIMAKFNHPNIISLVGVVSKSEPYMILSEYMENGSLDRLLQKSKGQLQTIQIVSILQNIALGMNYLNELGFVHQYLAAQNILVDNFYQCKINNFRLATSVGKTIEEEVKLFHGKSKTDAVRWSAPEILSDHLFTPASDVWSFGVVVWEVLSYGERPYWEMSNQDIVQFVECGYRLPAPCHCPVLFHKMMLDCWHHSYFDRPSFDQLALLLNQYLNKPSALEEQTINRLHLSQDECIPEIMDLSSLSQWLDEIHLIRYKPILLRHGCVTAEQIMRLNQEDLNRMGITDHNDINTILQEAEILRFKIEEVNKIGIAV